MTILINADKEGDVGRMNKHRGRMWVEALRSGEFPQGRYTLNDEGGYCCLGVACEIAIRDGVPVEKVWASHELAFNYDNRMSILPESVMEWLGVDSPDPDIAPRLEERDASQMASFVNDRGVSFAEIADMIESFYDLREDVK